MFPMEQTSEISRLQICLVHPGLEKATLHEHSSTSGSSKTRGADCLESQICGSTLSSHPSCLPTRFRMSHSSCSYIRSNPAELRSSNFQIGEYKHGLGVCQLGCSRSSRVDPVLLSVGSGSIPPVGFPSCEESHSSVRLRKVPIQRRQSRTARRERSMQLPGVNRSNQATLLDSHGAALARSSSGGHPFGEGALCTNALLMRSLRTDHIRVPGYGALRMIVQSLAVGAIAHPFVPERSSRIGDFQANHQGHRGSCQWFRIEIRSKMGERLPCSHQYRAGSFACQMCSLLGMFGRIA